VLESYNLGLPFADSSRLGLADTFARSGLPVEMFVEHLDANRVALTHEYLDQFAAFLRTKYSGTRLNVIVTCDDDALQFMLAYRDTLFPGIPVVFLGVDATDVTNVEPAAGVTGIIGYQDSLAVANTARRSKPWSRNSRPGWESASFPWPT
jgi:hypothetical protein